MVQAHLTQLIVVVFTQSLFWKHKVWMMVPGSFQRECKGELWKSSSSLPQIFTVLALAMSKTKWWICKVEVIVKKMGSNVLHPLEKLPIPAQSLEDSHVWKEPDQPHELSTLRTRRPTLHYNVYKSQGLSLSFSLCWLFLSLSLLSHLEWKCLFFTQNAVVSWKPCALFYCMPVYYWKISPEMRWEENFHLEFWMIWKQV